MVGTHLAVAGHTRGSRVGRSCALLATLQKPKSRLGEPIKLPCWISVLLHASAAHYAAARSPVLAHDTFVTCQSLTQRKLVNSKHGMSVGCGMFRSGMI